MADAIHWSDLEPRSLEKAQQLAREAQGEKWWNWPQAVAWVGARNLEHIATMRLCAEPWKDRHDHDPAVALGSELILASAYCADLGEAEKDLMRAIERGAIKTVGRKTFDSPCRDLEPLIWKGGKVVYNSTATLVSAANLLSEWACDISVSRADLWETFGAVEGDQHPSGQTIAEPRPRKKPGPSRNPHWPYAISKVTETCLQAGYALPLRRGEKQAIINLLLTAMAEHDTHPSDDTARKYADDVIARLPDRTTS
jgi:hypothetical protein